MAKYTTELRKIVESGYDLQLDEYPIFDELYRDTLNKKIIDHYFYREIGFETTGMFRHYLKTKMNEIMPYYNKMYQSELLELDPLTTFKEVHTENKDKTGTDSTHNTTSNTNNSVGNGTNSQATVSNGSVNVLNVHSDTPQGSITEEEIIANQYASTTDYTKTTSDDDTVTVNGGNSYNDTSVGNGEAEGQRNYTDNEITNKQKYGYNKSPAELLELYRKTFLNIDMMIIGELEDLFMQIW